MNEKLIYLDSGATTPCDPRVVEAMLPYFMERFGNSSSPHTAGTRAYEAVELAREEVAALLNGRPEEIIWTSGATESNNLAILGLARASLSLKNTDKRRRIVISAVEHKAVIEPCRVLEREGFEVISLPVEGDGRINLDAVHEMVDEQTLLVSIQAANGEVGTIQPISAIAQIAHEAGAWVHCDAAQAVGKIPVDVRDWDVDALSLSGHKFYAPQGIGALWMRRGLASRLTPLQYGGGQQRGVRPGTIPVALVVGLGTACQLSREGMEVESQHLQSLRDELEEHVSLQWPAVYINGAINMRLPHSTSLTFPGLPSDALLANIPDVALSTGSACSSGAIEPSPTLQAMGVSRADASSTVRVGLSRFTTKDDIRYAGFQLILAAERIHNST